MRGAAAVLAASVTEFSHFGFGGEAPILIRTRGGLRPLPGGALAAGADPYTCRSAEAW
ncbi:MAG: hypothetical protein ACE15B_13690 [Bryobacteraceae bacterium]